MLMGFMWSMWQGGVGRTPFLQSVIKSTLFGLMCGMFLIIIIYLFLQQKSSVFYVKQLYYISVF
jgi:hypothetical protein